MKGEAAVLGNKDYQGRGGGGVPNSAYGLQPDREMH